MSTLRARACSTRGDPPSGSGCAWSSTISPPGDGGYPGSRYDSSVLLYPSGTGLIIRRPRSAAARTMAPWVRVHWTAHIGPRQDHVMGLLTPCARHDID